jgi:hypothetical protein
LEIEVWDDRAKVGPPPAIDERLHNHRSLASAGHRVNVWRLDRINDQESPTDRYQSPQTKSCFSRGTLWIPHLGLGLTMLNGDIGALRIRKPEESPKRGHGSLTTAQREFSARADLYSHLVSTHSLLHPQPERQRCSC